MSKLKEYKVCFYDSMSTKTNKTSDLDNYVGMIQFGTNQDAVIKGRAAKQSGDDELYKKIKSNSMVVTPTGTYNSGDSKEIKNLSPNGIVCIDIDTELTDDQVHAIYNDQYSFIVHKSFGGDGYCVFVKIDPSKLSNAYNAISKYYYDTYGIHTDPSCKNPNRLRYVSYDPDVLVVDNSKRFNVKVDKKDIEPKKVQYIYTKSDLDNIFDQIRDKSIDLCKEDYYRYIRIGLAFANHFGESGREYFHFVCSYGDKYNKNHADRDFTGFIKRGDGSCTIGTFYHYCKEEGIEIYSERTRAIINRVNVSKSQGSATVESVSENLKTITNQEATEEEKDLIKRLIDSKTDYAKLANDDLTEIEQLANFIVDAYEPKIDEITHVKYVNGVRMEDSHVDDIYLSCKKNFDFNVNKNDIHSILNSSYVKKINVLKDFIRENSGEEYTGYIEEYAKCIYPQTEYNVWAFTRWMVGTMHNWFCDYDDPESSPLTLVLTGRQHGTGKTSFCRSLLPSELSKYLVQTKLSEKDKDSVLRMATSLIVFDDEFGGKAFKDDKEYKELSNQNHITLRRAYGREDVRLRRRASLLATTNEMDIIKDPTGNRRILPIVVEGTNYEKMVKMDKRPMIIEAYNLYKSGYEWRIFDEKDQNYIYENTSQNQAIIPMEEVFFSYFSLEQSFEHNVEVVMNQGEVLQYLTKYSGLKPTRFDIKDVFDRNELNYTTHRIGGKLKAGVKLYMAGSDINAQNVPF